MNDEAFAEYRAGLWPLPPRLPTRGGDERRVGVEIEFAGLDVDAIAALIVQQQGGRIEEVSDYEHRVVDTQLGDFGVELDFAYLKKLGKERRAAEDGRNQGEDAESTELADLGENLLALLAKQLVPFEVVGPPLAMSRLWELNDLFASLREAGAKGTGQASVYAFGLQLNPELPDLEASTILAYLRAFLCLYEWLKQRSRPDWLRRLTPYIDPFEKPYLRLLTAPDYAPDLAGLIDDYLAHNPTRNRALDMLPLFLHLDAQRVRAVVDDERVKARPTLHYRLPNCQIDEAEWGLIRPWRDWLQVEALASHPAHLQAACSAYHEHLESTTSSLLGDWATTCEQWLVPELL